MMDPTQAGQHVLESLLDKQWFVAAVIIFFFIVFVAGIVWLAGKIEKMSTEAHNRMDARDKEWFARMDKRDDETKEMVHNYYNATGTTSLTLQAVGQSMNNVADRLENVEDALSIAPKAQV